MAFSTLRQHLDAIENPVPFECEPQAPHALSDVPRPQDEGVSESETQDLRWLITYPQQPQPQLNSGGLLVTLQQNNDLSVPTSSAVPSPMSCGNPSPYSSWSTPGTWSAQSYYSSPSSPYQYRPSPSSPYQCGPSPTPAFNCYPDDLLRYHYSQPEQSYFLASNGTPPALTPTTDAGDDEIRIDDGVCADQRSFEEEPAASKARYRPLAPRPGNDVPKRSIDGDDMTAAAERKRRRLMSIAKDPKLSEQDRLLVRLKDEESLPWKDIADRFTSQDGQKVKIPALQMRYKRLREKARVWEDEDIEALKLAHEYWEKHKWDIISAKMLDYGIEDPWPSSQCLKKWAKKHPEPATPHGAPSTFSH